MSLSKLNNLYREVILDHAQHPHNYGAIANANYCATLENTSCGDLIHLQLYLNSQDIITQIGFTGNGCTISQASASMMTDAIKGKTKEQALLRAHIFSQMMLGVPCSQADLSLLQDAAILAVVVKFPTRIKCATLAWWSLKKALKENEGE